MNRKKLKELAIRQAHVRWSPSNRIEQLVYKPGVGVFAKPLSRGRLHIICPDEEYDFRCSEVPASEGAEDRSATET
jgi:hypothetical protein